MAVRHVKLTVKTPSLCSMPEDILYDGYAGVTLSPMREKGNGIAQVNRILTVKDVVCSIRYNKSPFLRFGYQLEQLIGCHKQNFS